MDFHMLRVGQQLLQQDNVAKRITREIIHGLFDRNARTPHPSISASSNGEGQ
jgi:hypothetical protein